VIDAGQYESLQAAFDAVPEGGAVVQIPPGRFVIDEPLVLETARTRLQGSGAGTRIINENRSGEPALIVRPTDYRDAPDQRDPRIWGVHLADFEITGNEESGDGIRAMGINEIYIHGLTVNHHGANGIALIDCYENPRVSESNLTYNAENGLFIERGHDIVVNGNEFEENQDGLRAVDSFNLTMNGNNLDDHLGNGVVVENTYGSVLSGNMIEESQGIAMIFDRDCYGITVSANIIAHNFGGGIDLRDAWGFTVSANTFTIVEAQSLTVGPNSGRISITGNNFSNSHIGGETRRVEGEATGILLDHTEGITITGNMFAGMHREAIKQVGAIDHLVIADNVMMDGSRENPGEYSPVDLEGEADVMENNSIED
jgi:parallel beta-helix repeat protein